MMKTLFVFMCLGICLPGFSQITFQKAYGGSAADNGNCWQETIGTICTTNDNGYIICHSTQSYGVPNNSAIYLIKLNAYGDTVFTKVIYEVACWGKSIHRTDDGGYILGADRNSLNGGGLIKINGAGNVVWNKSFPTMNGVYGLKTKSGASILTGYTYPLSEVYRLDANGNSVFGKTYSVSASSMGLYSVLECSNGDLVFSGAGNGGALIVKTDSMGSILFAKCFKMGPESAAFYAGVELSDKSLVFLGDVTATNSDIDFLLFKTDSAGNFVYAKRIGDSYFQYANNLIRDGQDNVYFTGATTYSNSGNNTSVLLVKSDALGNQIYSKRYDNGCSSSGLTLAGDNGIAICGITNKFGSGMNDVFVLKTDASGNAGCNMVENSIPPVNILTYTYSNCNLVVGVEPAPSTSTYSFTSGGVINTKCSFTITDISKSQLELGEVIIFPNPAGEHLSIQSRKAVSLQITDVSGKEILKTQIGIGVNRIDVSFLLTGLYFLNIKDGEKVYSQKLIKE